MRTALYFVLLILIVQTSPASAKEKYLHASPLRSGPDKKWVDRTLRRMSVEEKIGQLFMVWARVQFFNVDSPEYRQFVDQITRYHVGSFAMSVPVDGLLLIKSQPYEASMLLNRLQQQSRLPLLIAADFESGLSTRLNGPTVFPSPMAFGAAGNPEYAEAFGKITAQEARAIGVHWNFYPIADVNSNPANPIINTRSFGERPDKVGAMDVAYIRGARLNGMLTTAKHFPGHGDTATDSHLGVAQVSGDRSRLESTELPPFREAIRAGVDAVMVAHVTAPALEPNPTRIATTSPLIVTQLLKQQLGFRGIVITDALDMAGLTRLYAANIGRAAVDAFKAGNDVLLIPPDLDASYRAMLDAVRSREISKERLDSSVRKVLEAKSELGLERARLVDVGAIDKLVGAPANQALAQQVSDDAITLVRENGKVLPLMAPPIAHSSLPYQAPQEVHNKVVVIIFTEDVRLETGRALERQLRTRIPDANIFYVDARTAGAMTPDVLKATGEAEKVVTAVSAMPIAGARTGISSVISTGPTGSLLQHILDLAGPKTMVVAFGNPYLAKDFPGIQNYLCTFSTASVSEVSAAKALFGEIPIRGHLPVTIPNVAPPGTGIARPALH